jgi:surface antigen
MGKFYTYVVALSACAATMASCGANDGTMQSHGPIILGDSATIITEKDPQFLKDNVPDLQTRKVVEVSDAPAPKDTVSATPPPAQQAAVATPVPAAPVATAPATQTAAAKGLQVAFKPFTVFIPNITTRSFRQQDVTNAKGASYSLQDGKLDGNVLQVQGVTVTKVIQRYQTVAIIKDKESGNILLQSLGKYTSDWETLRGSGGKYNIAGLGKTQLDFSDVSVNAIRNAIVKAARANRLSHKEEQQLEQSARKARSVKQAPFAVALQNVVWRITGKDASGKSVEREVRIDLPVED